MIYSRRDLNLLLTGLAAATLSDAAEGAILPSRCYEFAKLPVKTNPQSHNQTRAVFDGQTHAGCSLETHVTTLAPGQMPHPPHHHVHDEMILVQMGTLEVTIEGNSTRIGPGSVAYVKSNEQHGWKNVGNGPAQYFVVAIGREAAA